MVTPLNQLLEGSSETGLPELRGLLKELLGTAGGRARVIKQQRLGSEPPRVYRLSLDLDGRRSSLIIKRLRPSIAQRNRLVISSWLPAVGLEDSGPILLGAAAERNCHCVWHVYEDFGDWGLNGAGQCPERVKAAVVLLAQLHLRFADHALLAECRLDGADYGPGFFRTNLRDALRCLKALVPPRVKISREQIALRDRLVARLQDLSKQAAEREQQQSELCIPETLLHGDLWTTNFVILPMRSGFHARLIDWDHAGVGPITYDLSTFLLRFPPQERAWILNFYREQTAPNGWKLPEPPELNLLFETAEYARFANRVIWPALALIEQKAEWAFPALAEVEQWFEEWQPVLPNQGTAGLVEADGPVTTFKDDSR
jgi:hypothetical protein